MTETVVLHGDGLHAVLAAHPVTRESYKRFLKETGRAMPRALARPEPPTHPVTYVSQLDALAYCDWLGTREGRTYRLPTIGELQELADESAQEGISPDIWAHSQGDRPEMIGGLKPTWLCEWTQETEAIEQTGGRPPRILGSIFYPPWLRQGSNASHVQAHLAADQGYSFVTFRVAYDERRAS